MIADAQLFPGLIYRMMKPKVVLLIFVSGKIVLTGAKVREEIYMAFNQIYSVLVGELISHLIRYAGSNADTFQSSEKRHSVSHRVGIVLHRQRAAWYAGTSCRHSGCGTMSSTLYHYSSSQLVDSRARDSSSNNHHCISPLLMSTAKLDRWLFPSSMV